MTIGKLEQELVALLNAALANADVCAGVHVDSVQQVIDERSETNWTADYLRGSGTPVTPVCHRVFIAAKHRLQRQYHLLTED